ncbi:MAG: aminoglycoside 6'-N-acetyltransferase [Pyrinomonadaceae bacterium]
MADKQYVVRPLEERDLNEWFRLRQLLWDATVEDDHKSEMLDIIEHSDSQLVLVAETGADIVGFLEVSLRSFAEDCETDHVGYLEGWFVDPAFRKMGIGGDLVRMAEMWVREKGCTEIASDAELGNEPSLAAHQKLGYEETSRLIHFRKGLD